MNSSHILGIIWTIVNLGLILEAMMNVANFAKRQALLNDPNIVITKSGSIALELRGRVWGHFQTIRRNKQTDNLYTGESLVDLGKPTTMQQLFENILVAHDELRLENAYWSIGTLFIGYIVEFTSD